MDLEAPTCAGQYQGQDLGHFLLEHDSAFDISPDAT